MSLARTLRTPLFLVAFLCLPLHAAIAEPLTDVCQELIGGQVSRCLAAPGGRRISAPAVKVCGQLIGEQVIDCVRAIAGKEYAYDEATTCGGLIGTQVIDCLRGTGGVHVDRPSQYVPVAPSYRALSSAELRAEIAIAAEQIRSGDPRGAEARLRRLLRAMP